jgi:hypothetical protein
VVRGSLVTAGVTHAQAAEALGMPIGTLRLRLYARTPFTVEEIVRVAEVCGLTASELVERIEKHTGGEAA